MERDMERKRACITSWDGTLRDGYSLRDWLLYLYRKSKIDYFGHADFSFHAQRYREGEISYEVLLYESYEISANCLKGHEFNAIADETQAFTHEDNQPSLYDFSLDLLSAIEAKDIEIIVISGGPSLPLQSYKDVSPLHQVYATEIEVNNTGRFTGKVLSKYGDCSSKINITRKLQESYDIVLAFGSNYTDIPMLLHAEHAFLKLDSKTPLSVPKDIVSNIRELNSDTIKFIAKSL